MKILDKYEAHQDKYQWVLVEYGEGKDRQGNPTTTERHTYDASYAQVLKTIIDRQMGDCPDIVDAKKHLDDVLARL